MFFFSERNRLPVASHEGTHWNRLTWPTDHSQSIVVHHLHAPVGCSKSSGWCKQQLVCVILLPFILQLGCGFAVFSAWRCRGTCDGSGHSNGRPFVGSHLQTSLLQVLQLGDRRRRPCFETPTNSFLQTLPHVLNSTFHYLNTSTPSVVDPDFISLLIFRLSERLKSLFNLFVGHSLPLACQLLQENNTINKGWPIKDTCSPRDFK